MGKKALLLLLTVLAMLVVVGGTALAITYTTSKRVSLKLNKPNYVGTALTKLASNAVGAAFTLETDSTDPNATPLSLQTETTSQAPMTVNSETKVANLNADKLDGKDSSAFLGRNVVAKVNVHDISVSTPTTVPVQCEAGEIATGGGAMTNDEAGGTLVSSTPINSEGTPVSEGQTPTGWQATFRVTQPDSQVRVMAICASAP